MARIADKNPDLKFAYAGRSKEKLEKTLMMARANTKLELADVPLITADVSDEESLLSMANQAKVVINCVGPVSSSLPISVKFFSSSLSLLLSLLCYILCHVILFIISLLVILLSSSFEAILKLLINTACSSLPCSTASMGRRW